MKFFLVPTMGQGDCFFDSVRHILASIKIHSSIKELREIVAYPMLDQMDMKANVVLQTWLHLLRDSVVESRNQQHLTELARELSFLWPVKDASWPLTFRQRKLVFNGICSQQYWGDEYALRILESQPFVDNITSPVHHTQKHSPTHYAMLLLQDKHYCPIKREDNMYLFMFHELPVSVQERLKTFQYDLTSL